MNNKGYIHLYTGSGKGKTTAALGLAIRASGAGKKVFIGQFVKGMHYSEFNVLKQLEKISIQQYGRTCFIEGAPTEEDKKAAQSGIIKIVEILAKAEYDVLILDEITIALFYNLISIDAFLILLKSKPKNIEIILTGRKAPVELYEIADLITEMNEIKHYYNKGIQAREGIEY
ncbi:MAG: cob(I)yrinic acid a,c-diamide adenosyltransferase [Bacteroidales bacterium]|nr:cob(I)yrinic acid a,c-diamide adenosyltransferase [Bacteroidales bacterium]